ncbi:hypothetical protein G7077_06775 [Sphingomonas piscis]|uniref:Uncharacterized protein n=1 Tax=Sphingomonas piscis TaxID=2714943 RepID=A0A6G7YPH4_9SPHN|nr:hypothetical protein [Sphingomonas piscis]QIK78642.1 hypothetical protein G7077_06775 [Sphingomonas piscis]
MVKRARAPFRPFATGALAGRLPVSFLVRYLEEAKQYLTRDVSDGMEGTTSRAAATSREIGQVLGLLADALNVDGSGDFSLEFVKRRPGRPTKGLRVDRKALRAAIFVEDQVEQGIKQEAAIAAAKAEFDAPRTAIYSALASLRRSKKNKSSLYNRVISATQSRK